MQRHFEPLCSAFFPGADLGTHRTRGGHRSMPCTSICNGDFDPATLRMNGKGVCPIACLSVYYKNQQIKALERLNQAIKQASGTSQAIKCLFSS